jgi:O-methyltransferase
VITAARIVNRLLRPMGAELRRTSNGQRNIPAKAPMYKYLNALQELHDCILSEHFPDMPRTEHRVELLADLEGNSISEALWILGHLHRSLNLEGDICEFGVAAGTTSALIANEIRPRTQNLWLFDSFQGLPEPTDKDELIDDFWKLGSMEAYAGTMSYPVEQVRRRLQAVEFPNSRVQIVPGFIEETIQTASLPDKVCFAFVDFDFYEPIQIALDFLSERLSSSGHIVVDDYGYFSAGAKRAVDEFASGHSKSFTLSLPPEWAGHFAVLQKHP